jgi:two-component system, OmpR family, response regulator QseB
MTGIAHRTHTPTCKADPVDRSPLLLVEDDTELAELLRRLLDGEGYRVQQVRDSHSALVCLLDNSFDVVVLDRGLPDGDGLDLLARLRRVGDTTPVLVLSAYGTLEDRVTGLDAGAEDYLVKPVEVAELFARLRALRRRHQEPASRLHLGEGWLDAEGFSAHRPDGSTVELSRTECDLLAVLAARPSRVFTREELRDRAFADAESLGAVDTYVYYIRRKLGRSVIRTVRSVGYRAGEIR